MISVTLGAPASGMSFSRIECVCCPEHCKQFSHFPDCDPLNPSRPSFRPDREKRIVYIPSPQLSLFGGDL